MVRLVTRPRTASPQDTIALLKSDLMAQVASLFKEPDMNETSKSTAEPVVPWVNSHHHLRVPDTSMLPGSEQLPPAAVASLNRVVHAAHDAVDRIAVSAEPKVRQLGERLSSAEVTLRDTAHQMGTTRDEWVEALRGKVVRHPLSAVAAAMALGALIVRVTRRSSDP